MKNNKFIPLTVLVGLCAVAVAMNNNQCKAIKGKCETSSCSLEKKKQDIEEKNNKNTKKSRRNKKSSQR